MQRGEDPFNDPVSRLKSMKGIELAGRAGGEWSGSGEGTGELTVPVLGQSFTVAWPEITIEAPESLGSFSLKLLCLLYLTGTDGTPPSGEWIAYRELPNGRFYEPVVKRSVEEPLAAWYGDSADGFAAACGALSGERLEMGDASFAFSLFPKVRLAFVLWTGDDEFPARAQVLFDSSASQHLNAFDLRMGAQEISGRLIRAGGAGR
jgi:hypothetical protein